MNPPQPSASFGLNGKNFVIYDEAELEAYIAEWKRLANESQLEFDEAIALYRAEKEKHAT